VSYTAGYPSSARDVCREHGISETLYLRLARSAVGGGQGALRWQGGAAGERIAQCRAVRADSLVVRRVASLSRFAGKATLPGGVSVCAVEGVADGGWVGVRGDVAKIWRDVLYNLDEG
jgi:hypothetical protein